MSPASPSRRFLGVVLLGAMACTHAEPSRVAAVAVDARAEGRVPVGADAGSVADAGSTGPARPPGQDALSFFDKPGEPGPWVAGRLTRVRVQRLRMPEYDGGYGATAIEFQRTQSGGAADRKLDKEGQWRVVTYVSELGAYLLGGVFQRGAVLPLDVLVYVDERTGKWRHSSLAGSHWMAFAAVPSPNGRFVAFVADADDGRDKGFELQALDTVTDSLIRLGKAPAPPPMDRDQWDFCNDPDRRFTWGDIVDGFVDMDAGILTFTDEHTLAVSTGADGCRRRARERRTRSFDLRAAFTHNPRLQPARFQ